MLAQQMNEREAWEYFYSLIPEEVKQKIAVEKSWIYDKKGNKELYLSGAFTEYYYPQFNPFKTTASEIKRKMIEFADQCTHTEKGADNMRPVATIQFNKEAHKIKPNSTSDWTDIGDIIINSAESASMTTIAKDALNGAFADIQDLIDRQKEITCYILMYKNKVVFTTKPYVYREDPRRIFIIGITPETITCSYGREGECLY